MKAKLRFLTVLAAGTLLASCGEGTTSSQSQLVPPDPTPSTSEQVPPTPGPEIVTYKVVIKASSGVNVTADKAEAEKGEKVTLKVSVNPGITLKALLLNGKADGLTKVDDSTYTFLMPDTSAVITTQIDVTGDCTVTGDVAAALEKQPDGSYKGLITCENESKINIKLLDTTYNFSHVDHDHSFGYYDFSSVKGYGFVLAGNAKYEIAVHPSAAKPVTIYRVEALHAPKTVKEVENLFNGDFAGREVLSGGAFYLRNLNSVQYKNYLSNDTYSWDLYENNVSYGTSTDNLGEVSHVYRALKGGEYVVVDNYVEAKKASDGKYYDDSVDTDTGVYSATYAAQDVVDEDNDPLRRYKITNDKARSEVAMPSHNMYGISREIAEGYRYGFEIQDDLVASKVAVTPTANADGGFKVDIHSWKNYDPSASSYDDAQKVERFEYDITLEFNKDTSLRSGSYAAKYYDESNWNFDKLDLQNGGVAKPNTKATTRRKMEFSYGYGAPKAGAPSFDLTPYFLKSIDSVTAKSKDMPENHVQLGATIDEARRPMQDSIDQDGQAGYRSLLKMTYSPSTALDAWQYGVVSSTDEAVIGLSKRGLYAWEALSQGASTLEIGNHIGGKVKASLPLTVGNNVKVKGYYLTATSEIGGMDSTYVPSSSKIHMTAGEKINVYLWAGPSNCDPKPSIVSSNPNLKVTLSPTKVRPDVHQISTAPAYLLTVDATAMTNAATENVTLTVTDPGMDLAFHADGKIRFDVTVEKALSDTLWGPSLAGLTYVADEAFTKSKLPSSGTEAFTFHNATLSFTGEPYVKRNGTEVVGYQKVTLAVSTASSSKSYSFGYKYDRDSLSFLSFKGDSWIGVSGYNYEEVQISEEIHCEVDKTAGAIGITYCQNESSLTAWDEFQNSIIGVTGGAETYDIFQWFKKA